MANINKVELNLGHKIANPFKTTRKSDTNPFKYSNFEGNTLQFADVFEGFEPKKINKLKMITSSVMGSMVKLRNSITEPIVNFVNRVKDGITTAWDYAKNTNIEIAGLKNITEKLNTTGEKIQAVLNYDIGKGISDSITGIGKNLTEKLPSIDGITGLGKDLLAKWTEVIGKVHNKGIPSGLSVAEYKELWIKENELIANSIKEAA